MSTSQQEFYRSMCARYAALTGESPDAASDISIRFHTLAEQLALLALRIGNACTQQFADTATGDALDAHAFAHGVLRKEATHARGSLLFTRIGRGERIELPIGTVCAAADGAVYETIQVAELIPEQGSMEVLARAVSAGKAGNAAAEMITQIRRAVGAAVKVSNPKPFAGGCDREDDDALRKRLLSAYMQQNNGANKGFYQSAAEGFEGISSAQVTAGEQSGTIMVHVAADGQQVVAQETLSALAANLNIRREPCTTVAVQNAQVVSVNIDVAIEPIGDFEQAQTAVEEALRTELDRSRIGQRTTLARLGQQILGSGVAENYRFDTPVSDINPSAVQVLRAGTVAVKRMEG